MNDELNGLKSTATGVADADVTAAATDLRTLIDTLCPDGVEWKALGDIFVMRNGYTPSKSEPSFWEDGTIPWFRMDDIRSNGNILADSIQHVTPAAVKGKLFPAESIILATTATIGVHALLTSDSLANQRFTVFIKRELPGCDIDMKFMFYYFFIVDEWCKKHIKVSSFPAVDVPALAKLKVPVPPLAVQAKIVQILDKFTELAKELAKEKQARRTQYEYYRDWLLDLAHPEGKQGKVWDLLRTLCPDGVEWKTVGEVTKITRGKVISKPFIQDNPGEYPVYSSQTENDGCMGYIDSYMFDGDYVTWTTDGANAGTVFHRTGKFNTTNVCGLLAPNQYIISPKYLSYILGIKAKSYVSRGMGNPKLMSNTMSKVRIPVPPLPVQAEIVRILDQFSTLAEDITAGLPAEIAARQTQYEYYRNQLLSFKDVSD